MPGTEPNEGVECPCDGDAQNSSGNVSVLPALALELGWVISRGHFQSEQFSGTWGGTVRMLERRPVRTPGNRVCKGWWGEGL